MARSIPSKSWTLPLLVAILAFAHLAAAAAQEESGRISIDQLFVAEDAASLTALVSVIDDAGQPVVGLTTFEASVDETPAALESVNSVVDEETGVAVLLLIDVSGSMAGEPLAQSRAAAVTFVQGLLEHDVAAVVPFAGGVPDQATFTDDRDLLVSAINGLQTESGTGTALHDAVVNGLAMAQSAPIDRRAVILLTDGKDSGTVSTASREDALRAAATAGLPIFTIALGDDTDIELLQALAETAGGSSYQAPTPSDVPAIFDAIGATLRGRYALTLSIPPSEQAERKLRVTLELDGATLTAQASFSAPGAVVIAEPTEVGDGGSAAVSEEGGGPALGIWIALIVLALLVSGAAGTFVARRRRRPAASPLAGGPGRGIASPVRPVEPTPQSSSSIGRLTIVSGPNAGVSVSLSSAPVDIGADAAAGLPLDASGGTVGGAHARVWLQGDHLMVHHLARGLTTLVDGRPIEWATLEPNDTLQIGPHVIGFQLDSQDT